MIIVVVICLLVYAGLNYFEKKETYNFGNFPIEKEKFNLLSEQVVGDFVLCNTKENDCILVGSKKEDDKKTTTPN